jgi:hypothetical protein
MDDWLVMKKNLHYCTQKDNNTLGNSPLPLIISYLFQKEIRTTLALYLNHTKNEIRSFIIHFGLDFLWPKLIP